MAERINASVKEEHKRFYQAAGISPSAVLQYYAEKHRYLYCPSCDEILSFNQIEGHPTDGIVHTKCGNEARSSQEPIKEEK